MRHLELPMVSSRIVRELPHLIRIALSDDARYEDPEQRALGTYSSAAVAASQFLDYLQREEAKADERAIQFLWDGYCHLTASQQSWITRKMQTRMGRPRKTELHAAVTVDRHWVLEDKNRGSDFLLRGLRRLTGKQVLRFAISIGAKRGCPPLTDDDERDRLRLGSRLHTMIRYQQSIGSSGLRGEMGQRTNQIEDSGC